MKIPKKIKIFDVWFTIRMVEDPSRDPELRAGEVGCTNTDLYTIAIDATASPIQQERTFYHEVVHAIMRVGGLTEILTDEMEEGICEALGHALPQIVRLK